MRNISFLGDYTALELLARDSKELHRVVGELSFLHVAKYPLVQLFFDPARMTIEATYVDQYADVQVVMTAYYNNVHHYWTVRSGV